MFYECSGCQVVMAFISAPPHVCPECGRAGIVFCQLDDQDLAGLMLGEADVWREVDLAASFGDVLDHGEDAGAPALG
jgi:hypothetical protein